MKLYVCWGTFPAPWRPGGHPCRNAYRALRDAGHDPEVVLSHGLAPLPDALANRSSGREAARQLTGKSTVPVLELDDGTAIWDSKRIVEWARANPAQLVGRTYEGIDGRLREWIARQPLFFVGTAPLGSDGHVNVSPKGPIGTLRVLDDRTVAYLDVVGSGAETIAHLRENGRIVVMLCAFSGPPRIVRLHGRGRVVLAGEEEFSSLLARGGFDQPAIFEARRALIVVDVERVADSCGYGVPLMTYEGERPHQDAWAAKKLRAGGPDALAEYQAEKNAVSIDGLPAVGG